MPYTISPYRERAIATVLSRPYNHAEIYLAGLAELLQLDTKSDDFLQNFRALKNATDSDGSKRYPIIDLLCQRRDHLWSKFKYWLMSDRRREERYRAILTQLCTGKVSNGRVYIANRQNQLSVGERINAEIIRHYGLKKSGETKLDQHHQATLKMLECFNANIGFRAGFTGFDLAWAPTDVRWLECYVHVYPHFAFLLSRVDQNGLAQNVSGATQQSLQVELCAKLAIPESAVFMDGQLSPALGAALKALAKRTCQILESGRLQLLKQRFGTLVFQANFAGARSAGYCAGLARLACLLSLRELFQCLRQFHARPSGLLVSELECLSKDKDHRVTVLQQVALRLVLMVYNQHGELNHLVEELLLGNTSRVADQLLVLKRNQLELDRQGGGVGFALAAFQFGTCSSKEEYKPLETFMSSLLTPKWVSDVYASGTSSGVVICLRGGAHYHAVTCQYNFMAQSPGYLELVFFDSSSHAPPMTCLLSLPDVDGKLKICLRSFVDRMVEQLRSCGYTDAKLAHPEFDLYLAKNVLSLIVAEHGLFSSGQEYRGQTRDGMAHGRGVLKTSRGIKIMGEFAHDLPHGKINITFPDGGTYEGDCQYGHLAGLGVRTWANGRFYTGEFNSNQITGLGTYTGKLGCCSGEFEAGMLRGPGDFHTVTKQPCEPFAFPCLKTYYGDY